MADSAKRPHEQAEDSAKASGQGTSFTALAGFRFGASEGSATNTPAGPSSPHVAQPSGSFASRTHGLFLGTAPAHGVVGGRQEQSPMSSPLLSSSTVHGDDGTHARRASPPRALPADRLLPSPPRPPRFSVSYRQDHAHPDSPAHSTGDQDNGGVDDGTCAPAVVADTPQRAAPLYLAATATWRSAEQEEAPQQPPQRLLACAAATSSATSRTATPKELAELGAATASAVSSAASAAVPSPSPSPKVDACEPQGADHAGTEAVRAREGGAKGYYAEEAEDFATMYKNAGLDPPDLDELEDEVLLGRSLSPALLLAKQRELSQHPPSSSGKASPGSRPQSSPPQGIPPPPPPASAATASASTAVGVHISRAKPRVIAAHAVHYPSHHGTPMPVFVSHGGGGGGGGSAGSFSRHGSVPHSMATSMLSHHEATGAGSGAEATSDHATQGAATREGHGGQQRKHTRRRRHRQHKDGSEESHEAGKTHVKRVHLNARHHRHGHSRRVGSAHRYPASTTLPDSPGQFPRSHTHDGSLLARASSSSQMTRAWQDLEAPVSPNTPEPAPRHAHSAIVSNTHAPRFPRDFGYLADVDDDGTYSSQSGETSHEHTSQSHTPSYSPTSTTEAALRRGDSRDVLYSLVPSARVSTGRATPAQVRGGEEEEEGEEASSDAVGSPLEGWRPTLLQATEPARASAHVGAAPPLFRAHTAPGPGPTQQESQRQLESALRALGLYMHPSSMQTAAHDAVAAPEPQERASRLLSASSATAPHTTTSPYTVRATPARGNDNDGDPRARQEAPVAEAASLAPQRSEHFGTLSTPVASPNVRADYPLTASGLAGVRMATFDPQPLGSPLDGRRSHTVPAVSALLSPAKTNTPAADAGPPAQPPSASSFTPGMSFNPARNASFLLNASFGQLANCSLVRDGGASSTRLTQTNREALVQEMERRRARLVKQLAQQQKEATLGNVFALVRGSNAWQLQYLLQENLVDVNERDYNGCTPLHVAALEGNQAIARILLSFGADVLAVDRFGRTPLDCAAANRHGSVGRYLLAIIRTRQQQQQLADQAGHAGEQDADGTAVEAAVEGEDSVPPTPFGLRAVGVDVGGGGGDRVHSDSPSLTPGTNASTMPDTGEGDATTTAATSARTWRTIEDSEHDGAARLLVPGAELIGRKHEKMMRHRARGESASGSLGQHSLNQPNSFSDGSCSPSAALHPPLRLPHVVGGEADGSLDAPLATSVTIAPESLTSSRSVPRTPAGSHSSAPPDMVEPIATASCSSTTGTSLGGASTTRSGRGRVATGVSRGRRTRRHKSPRQAALFAAEEDKFLEEQQEQIAEEVALSAAGGVGSPAFYRSTTAAPPVTVHHDAAAEEQLPSTATAAAPENPVPMPQSSGETEPAAVEEAVQATTVDAPASTAVASQGQATTSAAAEGGDGASSAPRFSIFTTISDTVSLIVCMCGLPGRGKSFISKRLVRYINWKGVPCRVFNAGNYRRQMLGVAGTSDAAFFDPNNPKGKEQRERMAELACEDLVRFIGSHVLAVGILDATNTTKARRSRLKHFFEKECEKQGVSYRLLFIESVCTDETIITENILRSKCDNDDFKDVQDTSEVIAEFRDRIHQYEKVYETLDPSEGLSFIKIINVKHHVIIHKVESGLGSRIAFFLQNLHPVAYPIYIVMAGETIGDQQGVFGGDERLSERGEAFAVALKQFVQDRYVPNMVVLHATNPSVLSTIRPLMEGSGGSHPHGSPTVSHASGAARSAEASATFSPTVSSGVTPAEALAHAVAASGKQSGPVVATSPRSTTSRTGSASLKTSPASRLGAHHIFPTELPPRKLTTHLSTPEELVRLAGGDLGVVAHPTAHGGNSPSRSSTSSSSSSHTTFSTSSSSYSDESGSSSTDGSGSDDDDDDAEEVLCPVPGLDNINFGRFSGHSAGWVREKYPRLSALLYVSALEDEVRQGTGPTKATKAGSPTALSDGVGGADERSSQCTLPPPCSAKLKDGGLAWFKHAPSHLDPLLAYCVQFPNGESCRQVNARLEPALMAVMRTQSPVFVVAPAVPAQGMLAFFADVIPELSPTLRIPRHCVVELGVKDDVTVHPLVPSASVQCGNAPGSPLMDAREIREALNMASSMAVSSARGPT